MIPTDEATHLKFMHEALDVARAGMEAGELPIGAVVVVNNEIIASSYTREVAEKRFLVHADLLALEAADRLSPYPGKRRETCLYVSLEPCLMCMGAAMSFFIGGIVYALEAPGDGALGLVKRWQRQEGDFPSYRTPEIIGPILRDQSIGLFKEYVARHNGGAMWEWAKSIAALENVTTG